MFDYGRAIRDGSDKIFLDDHDNIPSEMFTSVRMSVCVCLCVCMCVREKDNVSI